MGLTQDKDFQPRSRGLQSIRVYVNHAECELDKKGCLAADDALLRRERTDARHGTFTVSRLGTAMPPPTPEEMVRPALQSSPTSTLVRREPSAAALDSVMSQAPSFRGFGRTEMEARHESDPHRRFA